VEYRRLGKSGLRVSALGFGGWLTLGGSVDDGGSSALLDDDLLRDLNRLFPK